MKPFFTILLSLFFSATFAQKNSPSKVPQEVEFKNFFSQANIFLLNGQVENAIAAYNSCLKLSPNSAAVNYQLAKIFFRLQDFDAALNYISQAVKLSEDNYWYNVFLADVYRCLGNYQESIKIFETLIKKNPNYQDYLQLCELYVKSGKISSAISTLNTIESKYGFDIDNSLKKIDLLRRQNHLKEAEDECCKLVLTDSSNLSYLGMLEDFYLSISQISKAQEVVTKMQSIDDKNPLSYLAVAYLCRATGKIDCFYQNLVESFRGDVISQNEKISLIQEIVLHSQEYDEEKICQLYDEIVKADSLNFEVRSSYADFLMLSNKYALAAKQLKKCSEIRQSDFKVWKKLFKLYVLIEDYKSLNSVVKECEEYFPEQVDLMLFSAVSMLYNGDLSSAEEMFLSAEDFGIELTESANLYYFYLGVFNYKKKNFEKAFSFFDKFYEKNHSDYNLCAQYAYYLIESKKNLTLAQNIIKECQKIDNKNYYFCYVYAFYSLAVSDLKSAEYFIEKSLSNNGNQKEYILLLAGDIFYKKGDCAKAVEYWKLSLQKGGDPKSLNSKINNCR